jgi:hypothetical protein
MHAEWERKKVNVMYTGLIQLTYIHWAGLHQPISGMNVMYGLSANPASDLPTSTGIDPANWVKQNLVEKRVVCCRCVAKIGAALTLALKIQCVSGEVTKITI